MNAKMRLTLAVLGVFFPLLSAASVKYNAVPNEKTGSVLIFPAKEQESNNPRDLLQPSSDTRAILSQSSSPLKTFKFPFFSGFNKDKTLVAKPVSGQHHHGYGHYDHQGNNNMFPGGYYHGYGEYPISGYPQYYQKYPSKYDFLYGNVGNNYNGFGWGHGPYPYYPHSDRPYEYGYEGGMAYGG